MTPVRGERRSHLRLAAAIGLVVPLAGAAMLPGAASAAPEVVDRGSRLLGMCINLPKGQGYNKALAATQAAGVQFTHLMLNWTEIEKKSQEYTNGKLPVLALFERPKRELLCLTLSPVNAAKRSIPKDLTKIKKLKFDDPRMIGRFNSLLDYVLEQIPHVPLTSLVIGYEVDVYLGGSDEKWAAYQTFYEAVAAHAKKKLQGLKVGVTVTCHALLGDSRERLAALTRTSDFIAVTYYPLWPDFTVKDIYQVRADLGALVASAPGKQIYIQACGYPSSETCKGSEALQAEFVRQVFKAWDAYNWQIQSISFMTDWPNNAVKKLAKASGHETELFKEYLRTLGLLTTSGKPKEAFLALQSEAKARGW